MSFLKIQGLLLALAPDDAHQIIIQEIVDTLVIAPESIDTLLRSDIGIQSLIYACVIGVIYQGNKQHLQDSLISLGVQCVAIAYLVQLSFEDVPIHELLSHLSRTIFELDDKFDQSLRRIGHVVGWSSVPRALKHLYTGNPAQDDVLVGIYFLMRFAEKPDEAILITEKHSANAKLLINAIMGIQSEQAIPTNQPDLLTLARRLDILKESQ